MEIIRTLSLERPYTGKQIASALEIAAASLHKASLHKEGGVEAQIAVVRDFDGELSYELRLVQRYQPWDIVVCVGPNLNTIGIQMDEVYSQIGVRNTEPCDGVYPRIGTEEPAHRLNRVREVIYTAKAALEEALGELENTPLEVA